MSRTAYNDAAARATLMRFEAALKPLMADVAPDWLLHHMEIVRDLPEEQVRIVLVCKPIGSARLADADADLRTGPRRLQAG